MSKRETIEEFLARGGKITKLPPQPIPEDDENKVAPTTVTGGIMTLAEGGIFYAEFKPKVRKKKKMPAINVSALPPSLLKFLPKNVTSVDEEDDE